jgi:hypothetical protein
MKNKVDHLYQAADRAGMSVKTARKYLQSGQLPSESKAEHTWKTHEDAFELDWPWLKDFLENNHGIEAKSLFEHLQRERPGKYTKKQLRTFHRRVKQWKALEGPAKEIFFSQIYHPGQWAESDFTSMNAVGITINSVPFDHMLYHFVLCYSNWETGNICFSESYESLSNGLQKALWNLGGVVRYHKTDNLRCAVNPVGNPEVFNENYKSLARHYGFESCKTQPRCPHENGDVEQRHYRLKNALSAAESMNNSWASCSINSTPAGRNFCPKNLQRSKDCRQENYRIILNMSARLTVLVPSGYSRTLIHFIVDSEVRKLRPAYTLSILKFGMLSE